MNMCVVGQVTISFFFLFFLSFDFPKKVLCLSLRQHTTHTYKHKTSSDNSKKKKERKKESKRETRVRNTPITMNVCRVFQE